MGKFGLLILGCLVGLLVVVGCKTIEGPFGEIAKLAMETGEKTDVGYIVARTCIVEDQEANIALLATISEGKPGAAIAIATSQMTAILGFFPGNPEGEYQIGLLYGGLLISKESIGKEEAEEHAKKWLLMYKSCNKAKDV